MFCELCVVVGFGAPSVPGGALTLAPASPPACPPTKDVPCFSTSRSSRRCPSGVSLVVIWLVLVFFPEIGRGGVLFRFYMGSAGTFVSFCCNPSSISSSPLRIARSRRGEVIWGVGTLNGADPEIRIRLLCREIAVRRAETARRRTL